MDDSGSIGIDGAAEAAVGRKVCEPTSAMSVAASAAAASCTTAMHNDGLGAAVCITGSCDAASLGDDDDTLAGRTTASHGTGTVVTLESAPPGMPASASSTAPAGATTSVAAIDCCATSDAAAVEAEPSAAHCCRDDGSQQSESEYYLRPILVGYAFGPKKMSTMGVVMAEASKALSTVTMAAVPVVGGGNGDHGRGSIARDGEDCQRAGAGDVGIGLPRLTTAALEHSMRDDGGGAAAIAIDEEESSIASLLNAGATSAVTAPNDSNSSGIRFSIAGGPNGPDDGGIRNIIRFFQSSCSSVGGGSLAGSSFADSSITTAWSRRPSSPTGSSMSAVLSARGGFAVGGGGGKNSNNKQLLQAVRVSFVPLDLDSPLEEQHGGRFDAILHKMTEDILCISQMSSSASASLSPRMRLCRTHGKRGGSGNDCRDNTDTDKGGDINTKNNDAHDGRLDVLDDVQQQALRRVERLERYNADHGACCLVDHPTNVKSLMSRSDIAHILSGCLVGVTTRSGVPVGTPRFEVVVGGNGGGRGSGGGGCDEIEKLIDAAPFTYPLIVKPLPAAGTAASHRMVVVLNRHGLRRVSGSPCLLQEYANHDGVLYKVYVLGDIVRVFPRNSLPNLPCGECFQQQHGGGGGAAASGRAGGYVEFDSQRPYPKLSDFGVSSSESGEQQQQQQQRTKKQQPHHHHHHHQQQVGSTCSREEPTNQGPHPKKRRVTYTPSVESRDGAAAASSSPLLSPPSSSPRKDQERIKGSNKLANAKLVTADEIRPVASALRRAFGLELFGFDILVTSRRAGGGVGGGAGETATQGDREMLVVDVNYFPSYKEVSNFPSLLAQYLTQRAVEGRMSSVDTR